MEEFRNIPDGLDLEPIETRLKSMNPGPWQYEFTNPLEIIQDFEKLINEVKRLQNVEGELRDRIDQLEYTCEHY